MDGVAACAFADVDALGIGACPVEELRIGEVVVDDDVGLFDEFACANGDESWIAGTCADEIFSGDLRR